MVSVSSLYLDDPSKPSPTAPVVARMYDWYLGGTHSYAIDRQAALDVQKALPDIKPLVVENRAFLRRAVRYLTKNGITQFIDLGSGLPTAGSTHETALKVNPETRVIYVDIEETAVAEGKQILKDTGRDNQARMIRASALEPEAVFSDPETQRMIDFEKPVAIVMLALVHFFSPQQYKFVLDFWKRNLVKGSALIISHCTSDEREPESLKKTNEVYSRASLPVYWRTKKEIANVMKGWAVVDPGVSRPDVWRTEEQLEEEAHPPATKMWWVAVGTLP